MFYFIYKKKYLYSYRCSLCIYCLPYLLGVRPSLIIKGNKNQILFDPIIFREDIEKNVWYKKKKMTCTDVYHSCPENVEFDILLFKIYLL